MKPFTLSLPEIPAVTLLNRKCAKSGRPGAAWLSRMLSNVQLLSGASDAHPCRSDGRAHSDGEVKGQPRLPALTSVNLHCGEQTAMGNRGSFRPLTAVRQPREEHAASIPASDCLRRPRQLQRQGS